MIKFLAFLMVLVVPFGLVAGQGAVQLRYLPDTPVIQTSSVRIELLQQSPQAVPVSAYQEVQARLEIINSDKSGPIFHLPVDVSIDLQAIQVGAEAKGKKTSFDSRDPGSSPMMKELAKVIGHPMRLTVGEDLQVTSESKDFIKLLQQLESLGGFRASSLISEMFEHLFALAGHDLRVGQEYTQQLALGGDENIPMTLTYKVVAINDDEVRATISGGFASMEVDKAALGQGGSGEESLQLSGQIDGKAVWSRKNALIYKTRLDYVYDGVLKEDGRQVPVKVTLRHEDATR